MGSPGETLIWDYGKIPKLRLINNLKHLYETLRLVIRSNNKEAEERVKAEIQRLEKIKLEIESEKQNPEYFTISKEIALRN